MGNDQFNLKDNIFYLDVIPNISLEYFINHLFKYTNMSISSLILAIIYIDQFCEKFKYALSMHNIFRILLIFVYISIKLNWSFPICLFSSIISYKFFTIDEIMWDFKEGVYMSWLSKLVFDVVFNSVSFEEEFNEVNNKDDSSMFCFWWI